MRRRNTGLTDRNMFNNTHGAGKGDTDRSPNWREHYDEVQWPDGGKAHSEGNGFVRRGAKLVKKYGTTEPEKFDIPPNIKV